MITPRQTLYQDIFIWHQAAGVAPLESEIGEIIDIVVKASGRNELLDALQNIMNGFATCVITCEHDETLLDALDLANKAIAKAEVI